MGWGSATTEIVTNLDGISPIVLMIAPEGLRTALTAEVLVRFSGIEGSYTMTVSPEDDARTREAESPARFSIGDITCHIVSDGGMAYPVEDLYPQAPEAELSAGLAGRLDGQGKLPVPYRCLLIETPNQKVLIDTGLGPYAAMVNAPAGQLIDSLARAGFSSADVDVVVLTHAHPDHIGGLVAAGRLVFPDARHVMSGTEWNFWTSEDHLARLPDVLALPARAILPLVGHSDVLELAESETEVVPGVQLLPAPGHTIGHCAVVLHSGGEEAVFLADALLDELQLTYPHWVSAFDMLPDETTRTRTRLLDKAVHDSSLTIAYHIEGFGHVERLDGGYRIAR